jgi:hypothetical protein
MGDGLRVAEKVLKAHDLSVEQSGRAVEIGGRGPFLDGVGRCGSSRRMRPGRWRGHNCRWTGSGARRRSATEEDRRQIILLLVSPSSLTRPARAAGVQAR